MAQDWIGALLRLMRAPETARNREFLRNWGNWESAKPGSPATFNWLSTNRDEQNQYPVIDPKYGTRAYPNMRVGLNETLATLVHEMPELIRAFRSGNPSFNDPAVQTAFNRWGPEGVGHPGMSDYINAIAGTLRKTKAPPVGPLFVTKPIVAQQTRRPQAKKKPPRFVDTLFPIGLNAARR